MCKICAVAIYSVFLLTVGIVEAPAQESAEPIDCSSAEKLTRPEHRKMISFGVLNGKAISLITPPYPTAARAANIRGTVVVSVVIDTRGCVSEATAISGHPLLKLNSVKAALRSSFEPVLLSGKPVWFYGVITYNYISDNANWLEIGYFSDSPDKLIKHLPTGFDLLRTELKAADQLPWDERQKTIASALETIRVELTAFPKEQWLFALGRKLRAISRSDFGEADGLAGATEELKTFVEGSPAGVSLN